MAKGISNCLESMDDLERVLLVGIELAKGGVSLSKIGKLIQIVNDLSDLAADLAKCLPEIEDIDAVEAGVLTTRSYNLVKNIIFKIKA